MTQTELMQRAIELSEKNLLRNFGGPFGAIVACDGKIIATATNRVLKTNDPTAHAEIVAIRRASRRLQNFNLQDCEIFTSCEPCPMCLGAIYWSRIKTIYFANTRKDAAAIGFDDSYFYDELALPPSDRHIPMVSLLHHQAQAVFQKWARQQDRMLY